MPSGRWSISHTGARALTDHPRNTADETIKAVADKGGVVGVYFMPFLTLDSHPKGEDLLAHIEHVANVAGEDHVGIGTDNGVLPQPLDEEATKKLNEWAAQRIKAGHRRAGRGARRLCRWSPTTTASTATAASPPTCKSAAGARRGWRS